MGQGWNPSRISIVFFDVNFALEFCLVKIAAFWDANVSAICHDVRREPYQPCSLYRTENRTNWSIWEISKRILLHFCLAWINYKHTHARTHDANAVDSIRSECTLCTLLLRSTFAFLSLSLSALSCSAFLCAQKPLEFLSTERLSVWFCLCCYFSSNMK